MNLNGENIYSTLEKIAFTRPAGSEEEKKAAQIIFDEISKCGFEPTMETFEFEDSKISCQLKVLKPYEKQYNVEAYKHSKSTPEDGITSEFVYIDKVCENNRKSLKGKIVLANELDCKIQQLADIGVDGILEMTGKATDNADETDLHINSFRDVENRNLIQGFTIHAKDALEMYNKNASKVWYKVENQDYTAISQNVTVTIEGTELPNEIIAIGAHYDSVTVGHGASDNGGGAAIIMELFKYFSQNKPKRTLRFIWFGAEEIGLLGSKAYLNAHKDDLKNYRLMINVDVAGSAFGKNFVRATCNESVAHYIDFLAKEVGYIADVKQGMMGSDSTTFAFNKVPAIGFGRGAAFGLEFAHSRHDTLDYISSEALGDTANFVLLFADKVIDSHIFPIPPEIPESLNERINTIIK